MTTPAAVRHKQIYAAAQGAVGTGATIAETDALSNVVEWTMTEAGEDVVNRPNLSGLGGEVQPCIGARYWEISGRTEFTVPNTTGDLTTWQHAILWQSGSKVTDNGTTITLERALAYADLGAAITVEAHYVDGSRKRAIDCRLIPTPIVADGGTRIVIEWNGYGVWADPSDATLGTAPDPQNGGSCVIARNMTYADEITTSGIYSWQLATGVTIDTTPDITQEHGYTEPRIGSGDAAMLSVVVQWDDAYHTAKTARTALTPTISIGSAADAIVFAAPDATVVGVVEGEVNGGLTAQVEIHLATVDQSPWTITLGT